MFDLLPSPLHPAVVHLPIALTLLLPLFALGAVLAIRRGARPRNAWGLTLGLLLALVGSAWVATETGEAQEDRVEAVVGDAPIHTHEEAAEAFLLLAFGVLVVALPGLAAGRVGKIGRTAGLAGSVVLVGAGWNVGRSGGELVYEHGAAAAYTQPGGDMTAGPISRSGEDDD
ncbi:MAG TPA: DUF2231 domain-containing protein [Gemmatimonadales bacterium]|nr:DUF2231 domain-containing protein [Gemmatimonadales bacterium]